MTRAGSRVIAAGIAPFLACTLAILILGSATAQGGPTDLVVEQDEHAFLGVVLGGSSREGIQISEVQAGSAAESAGLEPGDVIVSIDGNEIRGSGALLNEIRSHRPGELVVLGVRRGDELMTLESELGLRRQLKIELDDEYFIAGPDTRGKMRGTLSLDDPGELEQIYLCQGESCRFSDEPVWYRLDCLDAGCPQYRVNFWGRPMLGIQILSPTPELRRHLGANEDVGLLVSKIYEGSPAERGGIEVGDVIVAIEGRSIEDRDDIRRALREGAGSMLEVEVIRDQRSVWLDVSMPESVEDD